jgi:protein HOOK3
MLIGSYSTEAAIALRQRLNESIDELDKLRKEHAELQVKFNSHDRELTIAKSDRKRFP